MARVVIGLRVFFDSQFGPHHQLEFALTLTLSICKSVDFDKSFEFHELIESEVPQVNSKNIESNPILGSRKKSNRKKHKESRRKKKIAIKNPHHPPPLQLDAPLRCDNCSDMFKNNVDFAYHSITHSPEAKYKCHFCDYRSSYRYQIGIHVRAHEGTTKFKCEICDKAFMVHQHAVEHKYFHTGERPFQCDMCGRDFMFSWRLAAHMKSYHYEIVTGKPLVKYDCAKCNKHYRSASGLRTHNIKKHKEVDLTVVCEMCGKKLANKERLKFHLRIHTGFKPFICHVCPKRFTKKDQLIEHIRTHTGERPYVCKICGKGFAQRTPLKTHQKNHKDLKEDKCFTSL